jgi:hypothetical protein
VPPEWASSTLWKEDLSQILMAYRISTQWHDSPSITFKDSTYSWYCHAFWSYVCRTCTCKKNISIKFKKLQERI